MTYEVLVNATGYLSIMQYANRVVGGFYGIAILISILAIVFFAGLNYRPLVALQGALFVTLISSIFLYALSMIEFGYIIVVLVGFIICFIAISLGDK